jgi:hypothetical protein
LGEGLGWRVLDKGTSRRGVSDDISRLVWISVEFRNMFDLVNSN